MNAENFKLVLDMIKEHPEQWDQRAWHHHSVNSCQTTHCFAGWAQLLCVGRERDAYARQDAMVFLDVNEEEAEYLFSTYRKIEDFERFYEKNACPVEYVLVEA